MTTKVLSSEVYTETLFKNLVAVPVLPQKVKATYLPNYFL